ncbi:MAG: hypothetical protein V4710_17580, partial [Verrucomicrobiota bacterium]
MNSPFHPGRISHLLLGAALLASLSLNGCKRKADTDPNGTSVQETDSTGATLQRSTSSAPGVPPGPRLTGKPLPVEIWKEFSGEKALAEVKKQVDIGPRPSGSAELEKARAAI